MVGVKEIADEIGNLFIQNPDKHVKLKEVVARILEERYEFNSVNAAIEAEDMKSDLKKELLRKIDSWKEKGVKPFFDFGRYRENTLFGRAFIKKADGDQTKSLKERYLHFTSIREALAKLEWRPFEFFCEYILELYGFRNKGVTRSGREGGIDFYGLFNPWHQWDKERPKTLMNSMKILVVGQARHKKDLEDKIGEGDLRRFSDEFRDFQEGKGRAVSLVPFNPLEWRRAIFPLFFTNTDFTSGATELAIDRGVILRNGTQLIEDLIRFEEKKFGFENSPATFNEGEFLQHFSDVADRR